MNKVNNYDFIVFTLDYFYNVKDEINGFLVPVKDSKLLSDRIITVLSDDELMANMGKQSRIIAEEKFSIENVIEKTLDLYNN